MEVDLKALLHDFLAESTDLLDSAEETALSLKKEFNPEYVNTLFRAIHTIKGNSGIFEFPAISSLSHSLENLLNHWRRSNSPPGEHEISIILECLDELRLLLSDVDLYKNRNEEHIISRIDSELSDSNSTSREIFGFFPKNSTVSVNGNSTVSPLVNRGSKVVIPKKYLERAKSENLSLYIVRFNSLNDRTLSLHKEGGLFRSLEGKALVLQSYLSEPSPSGPNRNGTQEIHHLVLLSRLTQREIDEECAYFGSVKSVQIIFQKQEENKRAIINEAFSESGGVREIEINGVKPQTELTDNYLRIPLNLLDHLINLAGETIIVRNQLLQKMEAIQEHSLLSTVRNLSQLITLSQESIMRTRLQRLETFFKKIPRLVHDLERTTNKEIELHLEGGDVELDKTIIDTISDPITHMIRNSADHGLEFPQERILAGKPRKGRIYISAALRGGNVILQVRDDGKGFNYDRIREKAIEKGLLTIDEIHRKTEVELAELVFVPGFSTSETVSSTSGRGVGMDVVKMNLQKAGGSVAISSITGSGTTITATIPQTLSILNCQMVRAGNMLFAIPQQNITELLLLDPKAVSTVENKQVYLLRGHLLPIIDLDEMLDLPKDDTTKNKYIVAVHTERHAFGLLITEIENPEEIVVKPLSKALSTLNLYTGAAILGDGNLALILDISGIAKFLKLQNASMEDRIYDSIGDRNSQKHYLLFTVRNQLFGIDSKDVQRLEIFDPKKTERILDREIIQYREEVVELCRLENYFSLSKSETKTGNVMILFRINGIKKGLVVNEIHNVVDEIPSFTKSEDGEKGIIGSGILSGETIIIIAPTVLLSELSTSLLSAAKEAEVEL
ncbi:CheW-like protein [Leptospira inadai serovar Lyme str. 10]|uniref:histidine kinase n=2 Tax=Leptospira inadai serovar Lyme TaxID=293084 RepID=V6HD48_9LEPT|nr:chemotaxis protein CheW [Leptospira inadai]EQA37712.1 CheW-like protein [Leptospira inadai serovar Lyme str. 10]PNV76258.1 chemotaxis protein CheA [Leptospira inadai serovar Lyme]